MYNMIHYCPMMILLLSQDYPILLLPTQGNRSRQETKTTVCFYNPTQGKPTHGRKKERMLVKPVPIMVDI